MYLNETNQHVWNASLFNWNFLRSHFLWTTVDLTTNWFWVALVKTNRFIQWATAASKSYNCTDSIQVSKWTQAAINCSRTLLTVISRPLVSIGSRKDMTPATMAVTLYSDIATWTDTRSNTCTHTVTHTHKHHIALNSSCLAVVKFPEQGTRSPVLPPVVKKSLWKPAISYSSRIICGTKVQKVTRTVDSTDSGSCWRGDGCHAWGVGSQSRDGGSKTRRASG